MDRKSIIIIVLSVILLLALGPIANKIFPPIPVKVQPTNAVSQAEGGTNAASATATELNPAPVAPEAPEKEELAEFETADAVYTFTSHGGGLREISLKKYPDSVACNGPKTNRTPVRLNHDAPRALFSFLGTPQVDGNGYYHVSKTDSGVRMEKTLPSGLRLVKEFTPSSNYLVNATVRIENPGAQPQVWPGHEMVSGNSQFRDEPMYTAIIWFDGSGMQKVTGAFFENKKFGCMKGTPRSLYEGGQNNVSWAGVQGQFFSVVVIPSSNAPASHVTGRPIKQNPGDPDSKTLFEAATVFPPISLKPGEAVERRLTLYAGPKEYNLLASHALRMNNNLDKLMDFGFFAFFSKILLLSLNKLHQFGLSYGLAIVALTVIIKMLFWPLTNASTKSMKRMAVLQPEMQKIQEKYKDDPAKKNQKLMEFMKENKVNPVGGCLPLFLQMPVFFGLIGMLRTSIELRGASFLWACDLSQADTVGMIGPFPINPMWFLMLVTMIVQIRQTPMSPGMDPMQQKMMKYMPIALMAMFYNYSAGLTLYWGVQNLLSILQTKITKAYTKNQPAPAVAVPKRK